jgi:hypothetical protein
MPKADDALRRMIHINYNDILTQKEEIVKRFSDTLMGRN